MIIKFEWNELGRKSWMEYDAEVMIKAAPMTNYKKWVKLFAKYGTTQQHKEFLELIKEYYREEYETLNLHLANKDGKAAKRVREIMKKYDRKYEILLRLL